MKITMNKQKKYPIIKEKIVVNEAEILEDLLKNGSIYTELKWDKKNKKWIKIKFK
jgi:hypothetical protein